ncbi:MAG: TolC family protein [Candidatus Aminicenantes bacterium]|nr:TolC family protein [Candidatus Aminicenantes bacterium]
MIMPKKTRLRRHAAAIWPALILVFAPAFAAQGTQNPPPGLSLAQAVETALARHPDVLMAQQAAKAAAGRRLQAEARPDPSLSLDTLGIPWTLKSGDSTPEYSLGLEQTIEFPGRRAARVEIAKLDEESAGLEIERIRLLIAARVRKAYSRAVLAERTLAATEPLGGLLDRFLEAMTIRFQSGDAAYGDILRARVEKARLQNRLIEARREQAAARGELLLLIGLSPDEPIRLTDDAGYKPFGPTLAQVLEAARAGRPSLRLARLRASRAEAETRLAALAGKPDFSAGLFVPSKSVRGWGVSFGLSLPLSRRRTEGIRAEASAARETSLIGSAALDRRLTVLIGTAYADMRSAEEQVKVFEQKLLSEIEAEIGNGLEQYRLGRIESYALLDLYRALSEARLEHLHSLYLYAASLADLEAAGEDY